MKLIPIKLPFCCSLVSLLVTANVSSASTPLFTEVSAESGISGLLARNSMGAGIAWIDIDNDGWMDLYATNSTGHDPFIGQIAPVGPTGPNRLYRNNGDGSFTEIGAQANVQLADIPSIGVTVGDYDNDGFDDIFVANVGVNTLLRNNGDGTFSDVTISVGLDDMSKESYAGAFGDVDGDGDLDLYVSHWTFDIPSDGGPSPLRTKDLYLNDGANGFINVSVASGADNSGASFVSPMTDYDGDGDLDLFAVNDKFSLWLPPTNSPENEMYRNDGVNADGIPQFVAVGAEIGVNQDITGMGVAIGDVDNDGDLDYYRSQYQNGLLSINDGTGTFTTSAFGDDLAFNGVGWGTVFVDVNNDGFIDLYRGNEASAAGQDGTDTFEPNTFYLNQGGSLAADSAEQAGLTSLNAGLGIAVADYDNDGDMDIAVHGQNGDINLFRNDTATDNKSMILRLHGVQSNKRGIGAKVRIVSGRGANVIDTVKELHAGSSHGSTHSFAMHFGLGASSYASRLIVEWPSGCVQVLRNVGSGVQDITEDCTGPHVLTGRVVHEGGGLAGATVWDALDWQATSTTTDAAGVWSISGYAETDSAVLVYVGRDGFVPSRSIEYLPSVTGGDKALADVLATQLAGTIAGTVRLADGNPLAGVEMWNVFDYPDSVYTDANGLYVLSGFAAGDNAWVLGLRQGLSMLLDAGDYFFTHNGDVVQGHDFTSTLNDSSVAGHFHTPAGAGVDGLVVWDAVRYPESTVSADVNGYYVMPGATDGAWVVLVPDPRLGYTVLPSIDAFVKEPGPAIGHNFEATPEN